MMQHSPYAAADILGQGGVTKYSSACNRTAHGEELYYYQSLEEPGRKGSGVLGVTQD